MTLIYVPDLFVCRNGTAANLATVNEVPLANLIEVESDTGRFKFGDGSTAWNSLLYANAGHVDLTGLADGYVQKWDNTHSKWIVAAESGGVTGGYLATSTTSLAIAATGSKSFTITAGLSYSAGARIRATSTAAGNWMEGVVSSYTGTTLAVTMDTSDGTSGTHADWDINLAGQPGAAGAAAGGMGGGVVGGVGAGTDAHVANVIGLYPMDTRSPMGYVIDIAGSTITNFGQIKGDSVVTRFGKNTLNSTGFFGVFNTAQAMCYIMGTQDFTWEADFLYSSLGAYQSIISSRPTSSTTAGTICVGVDSTAKVYCYGPSAFQVSPTAAGLTANTWHNIALSCTSGVGRLFVDGNLIGSSFTMPNLNYLAPSSVANGSQIAFGANANGAEPLTGNMANARITLGVGRYTANYTPATDQWPFS